MMCVYVCIKWSWGSSWSATMRPFSSRCTCNVYVCIYVCMCVCMYDDDVCVCIRMYMCVCMKRPWGSSWSATIRPFLSRCDVYLCMYVCVYVCVYDDVYVHSIKWLWRSSWSAAMHPFSSSFVHTSQCMYMTRNHTHAHHTSEWNVCSHGNNHVSTLPPPLSSESWISFLELALESFAVSYPTPCMYVYMHVYMYACVPSHTSTRYSMCMYTHRYIHKCNAYTPA